MKQLGDIIAQGSSIHDDERPGRAIISCFCYVSICRTIEYILELFNILHIFLYIEIVLCVELFDFLKN